MNQGGADGYTVGVLPGSMECANYSFQYLEPILLQYQLLVSISVVSVGQHMTQMYKITEPITKLTVALIAFRSLIQQNFSPTTMEQMINISVMVMLLVSEVQLLKVTLIIWQMYKITEPITKLT